MFRRLAAGLALMAWTSLAIAALSPQSFIEELLADYRTMKAGKDEQLPLADRQHNDEVRKRLLSHLDVETLGRLALQDHWQTLSPQQQTEFLTVLRTVLEQRSLRNIRGTAENFQVQFDGVDSLAEGHALVKTILQAKNDEFYLDFKLEPRGESWIIYDVITDDVSTVRNYRDQFNKIISEKGFDELLRRMRENLVDGQI